MKPPRTTTFYRLDRANPEQYAIRKLDEDFNLVMEYEVTIGKRGGLYCTCPHALNRHSECRHTKMIRDVFLPQKHVGDGALYCHELGIFREPLNQE